MEYVREKYEIERSPHLTHTQQMYPKKWRHNLWR